VLSSGFRRNLIIACQILTQQIRYGWDLKKEKKWLAWLLAFLYAMTDEFHQSFTPGRHPSVWDVVVFDNLGTTFGLWLTQWWLKRKRPGTSA